MSRPVKKLARDRSRESGQVETNHWAWESPAKLLRHRRGRKVLTKQTTCISEALPQPQNASCLFVYIYYPGPPRLIQQPPTIGYPTGTRVLVGHGPTSRHMAPAWCLLAQGVLRLSSGRQLPCVGRALRPGPAPGLGCPKRRAPTGLTVGARGKRVKVVLALTPPERPPRARRAVSRRDT